MNKQATTTDSRVDGAASELSAGLGGENMGSQMYCAKCGESMRYNVPRLAPMGGFVHTNTGSFQCVSSGCSYCGGSREIEMDNNGPIVPCPVCSPTPN